MAFKETSPTTAIPDSPEKLFLDLPRRKIPGVLPHQQELMQHYASTAIDLPDVALQLPTGSGKTLVGLLIGEWRRIKYKEKVVYLAPTKQLVNQVVEQAEEKYGLTVHGFTGRSTGYDPKAKADYKSGTHIAITTYTSLFNSNPFFDDADVIILDDVHVAENYVSGLWSLRIDRQNSAHDALHKALSLVLKPILEPYNFARLMGEIDNPSDRFWVDKLSTPDFFGVVDQITEILDTHTPRMDLAYNWKMIRDHIKACHIYLSSQEILIRPLIPPTWDHPAFARPKQRIYMSATLGDGGDLERLVGRSPITRLPISEGWDRQGVGRRFFIFPGMSLNDEDSRDLRLELMKLSDRSLILVPTNKLRDQISEEVKSSLGYKIFGSEDIEVTKRPFIASKNATAIMANRYDGIDFPGDECRLLFIEGLPRAMNLQERFLMTKMGANILFNERIQTRVLQAIGRCTRSLEDYSAVVVSGDDLPDYLADTHRRPYFHPELQAELTFGVDQSKNTTAKDVIENLKTFLENGEAWEKINQKIVADRKSVVRKPFPSMPELQEAVEHEITYQKNMWQGDFEAALASADIVLSKIKTPELSGYRALWHYLAGAASWLALKSGGSKSFEKRSQDEFSRAKKAATSIPWLVPLARHIGESEDSGEIENTIVLEQVERMETVLASLGTTYERQYSLREKEILSGLSSSDTGLFENAHKELGTMLGFISDKEESDGSPDPWWISANICLVFEDHSGAQSTTAISVSKARQAAAHHSWMRKNVSAAKDADILPVLITPATTVKEAAISSLKGVALWNLSEFQKWAREALAAVRELRTSFTEPGNLTWRADAVTILKKRSLDAVSLIRSLKKQMAIDMLKPVK